MSGTLRDASRRLRSQQTPAEQRLWDHLRAGRFDQRNFRRQRPIGPYVVDFYCGAAQLVVEVDGAIHEQQREYDGARDVYLAAYGRRVMRFTDDAIDRDITSVLAAIRHAIATS